MKAFILSAALCCSASAAEPSYFIRCGEYQSSIGHMLSVHSYAAYWDLNEIYPSSKACDVAAGRWIDTHYHGGTLSDGSRMLAQCWCEKVQ